MIACIKKHINYLFPLYFSLFVMSCSITGNDYKANESISEYAELLFRRQNFLTQQVMMLIDEEISFADEEDISQAELQMHDACRLLNEYAVREVEGKTISIFFRRRLKSSFKQCDESVRNMQLILTGISLN